MDKLFRGLFCVVLGIFLSLGATTPVLAYSDAWKLSGPYGANVTALKALGGTVVAGTEQGHLYKSSDQGSSWTRVQGLPAECQDDEYVTEMVVSGSEMLVAVGKQNNPYSDRIRAFYRYDGTSFRLDSQLVFNWAQDAEAYLVPRRLVAATNSGEFLAVGKDNTVLKLIKADGSLVTLSPNLGAITSLLNQDGVFWLITLAGNVYKTSTPMVVSSWQHVGSLPVQVKVVNDLVHNGAILWVEATVEGGKGLFSSSDGSNWVANVISTEGAPLLISEDFMCFGKQYSLDQGQNWHILDKTVNAVHKVGAVVHLGTSTGIFRSTDSGSNFSFSSNFMTASASFELLQGGFLTAGELFVASEAGVFRSTDWGLSWAPVVTEASGSITLVDGNTLLRSDASTEGVYRYTTSDGRGTFTLAGKVFPYGGKLFHDAATGTTYLGGWNGIGYPLKVSNDGGQSWSTLNTGLAENINVYKIKKDPAGRINLATSDGLYQWNGTTFVNKTQQQFFSYQLYDFCYVDSNIAYAIVYKTSVGYKIIKTIDNGQSWLDVTPVSIAPTTEVNERNFYSIYADSAQVVYVGTFSGGKVYKTSNGGTNWVRDAVFVDKPKITSFEKIGNGHLYATTSVGVWDPPVLFDAEAPELSVTISEAAGMKVTATLNETGRIYYELSNQGEPPLPQPWVSPQMQAPILIDTPGTWYLKVWAEDDAGNPSEVISRTVEVESVLPYVETDTVSGKYNTDLTVTFRLNDSLGKLYYTASFADEPEEPSLLSERLDDGNGLGIHYIPYQQGQAKCKYILKVLPVDRAGQVGKVQAFEYEFESEAPVLTATPKGGIFVTPVDVAVTLSEAGNIHYQWQAEVSKESPVLTGPLTVSTTGRLNLLAVDQYGNETKEAYDFYIQASKLEFEALGLKLEQGGLQLIDNIVYYFVDEDVTTSVYGYDLDTGYNSHITNVSNGYGELRLAETRLAYNTEAGLCVRGLDTNEAILQLPGSIMEFDISDASITYFDEQQVHIMVYGLQGEGLQQLLSMTEADCSRRILRVTSELIAYFETSPQGSRIIVRTRNSGLVVATIEVRGYVQGLELSDKYLVWSAAGDICLYCMATGEQLAITCDGYELADRDPDVAGETIVWRRAGQLYWAKITSEDAPMPESPAEQIEQRSNSRGVSGASSSKVADSVPNPPVTFAKTSQIVKQTWSKWTSFKKPAWLAVFEYFI